MRDPFFETRVRHSSAAYVEPCKANETLCLTKTQLAARDLGVQCVVEMLGALAIVPRMTVMEAF